MSLWDDTPTTLTVFGPLSSDVTPSGGLLSRLLRRNREGSPQSTSQSDSQKSSRETSNDRDVVLPRQPSICSSAGSSTSEKEESEIQTSQEKVVPQQQQNTRRTLSSVLNRLSNILERRPMTPQAYKDSDFKQYWMPDSSCKECYDCGDKFMTFRRRHHCRICGQIFCSKCCNQELPGKIIGYKGGIRVCTYCGKVALSALQSEPSGDFQMDREDLGLSIDGEQAVGDQSLGFWGSKKKESPGMTSRSNMTINMSGTSLEAMAPFDLTPMSEYSSLEHFNIDPKILQDSAQLRELWRQLQDSQKGVEMQSHRIRLRTYHKCIVGNRLVDWLMKNDRATQRLQAVAIGQALLDAGYIEVVSGQPQFQDDFTLYKPSKTSPIDQPEEEIAGEDNSVRKSTEPKWLQEIKCEGDDYYSESENNAERHDMFSSSSSSNKMTTSGTKMATSQMTQSRKSEEEESKEFEPLPRQDTVGVTMVDDIIAGFTSSQSTTAGKIVSTHSEWRGIENMKEENGEKMAYTRLQKAHQEHLSSLVSHMVNDEGLSKSWIDIIHRTAERISTYVRPDVKQDGDDMDVRKYVHFKKIPGGNKEQTCMIHGVVFTKNLAHKKMSQHITNPRILLLKGSIEYQRVENKFSSLEPQILQEQEFLRKNIAKISSLNPCPDVIIVEKSVSRLAQEYLLQNGLTLAFNVKLAVMERIERFTQACIVPSIDGIVSGPIRLGFCHNFKVCNFNIPTGGTKTVLIFDGCATHLGCTVMLRGGTTSELKRIKKIMKSMVYAAYHSQLEISFCMDEFAVPPAGEDNGLNLEGFGNSEELNLNTGDITKPELDEEIEDSNGKYLPVVESGCDLVSLDTGSFEQIENGVKEDEKNDDVDHRDHNKIVDESVQKDNTCKGDNLTKTTISQTEENDSSECKVLESSNFTINSDPNSSQIVGEIDKKSEKKAEEFISSFKLAISGTCCSVFESDSEMTQEEKEESIEGNKQEEMDVEQLENIQIDSVMTEHVTDQSDPLHTYQKNQDDTIFSSSLTLQEKKQKHCQKFSKILDEVLLTTSPYVKYKVPYLESEAGSRCINRKYFPDEIYTSRYFESNSTQRKSKFADNEFPVNRTYSWTNIEITEAHPLILCQLTAPLSNKTTQNMLADFRARGGRIKLKQPVSPVVMVRKDSDKVLKNGQLYKDTGISTCVNRKRLHWLKTFGSLLNELNDDMSVCCQRLSWMTQDCCDFNRHQRLAVLLSSNSERSANHPYPCLPPQIVTMEFYGSQDITLGGFLEKFCFRESYSCQPYTCPSEACDIPMLDHVRRIVHGDGSMYISLRKLTHCVPGGELAIMMWNWCRKCRQATPLVPMSRDTWNISFAKYLELRFHCPEFTRRASAEPCSHSLHHNCSQYFGHRNIVATFKYYPIGKLELALPPNVITLQEGITKLHWLKLKEEVKYITNKGTDMYCLILENVVMLNVDAQCESLMKLVTDFKDMLQNEKACFRTLADSTREKINEIMTELEAVDTHLERSDQFYVIHDEITKMKRFLTDAVINWNMKLQELYSQNKKHKQSVQSKRDREISNLQPSSAEEDSKLMSSVSSKQSLTDYDYSVDISNTSSFTEIPQTSSTNLSEPVDIIDDKMEFPNIKETYYTASVESGTYSVTPGINAGIKQDMPLVNNISPDINTYILLQQVVAGSFETMAEKVNVEDVNTDIATMVTKEVEENYGIVEAEPSKNKSQNTKIMVKQNIGSALMKKTGSTDDLLDSQSDKISGLKKTLTSFWTGTGFNPLLLPFDASEHHLLPTCQRVPVPVYDQEPSSIVAYALSSHDYYQKLQEIQTYFTVPQKDISGASPSKMAKSGDPETGKDGTSMEESVARKNAGGMLSFLRMSKEASPKMSRKMDSIVDSVKYVPKVDGENLEIDEQNGFALLSTNVTESEKSKAGKQIANYHIELQFSDNSARFYCKVYFAEQFRQLRKLIFPSGEDMYIRTLSRCKIWEAKGGKSGSAFCKTNDDRFILKQMSGIEVEIFEKFGPEYFQYVSKSYQDKKPTALAKIVGVYRIGFRNTHTNSAMKQDMLVVENLFYSRKISQKFDLKGSMRNRLVKSSGKREEELVLLDENLLKLSVESPLYIYPHSKAVLMMAINRDSEFLSSNLVMDYSLLVGLDENTKELVVGIIDYIRTFTWDKKLETLLKSVNTGGKMPTVVSPEIYRTRFLEAMGRYFQPVPDQWYGLGKEMES